MAWIQLGKQSSVGQTTLLREILVQLAPPEDQLDLDGIAKWHDKQLLERIQQHLQGKRFLIVLDDIGDREEDRHFYDGIKSTLLNTNCSPGSAILVTTFSRMKYLGWKPYIQALMLISQIFISAR
jgi:hypothetical protein